MACLPVQPSAFDLIVLILLLHCVTVDVFNLIAHCVDTL